MKRDLPPPVWLFPASLRNNNSSGGGGVGVARLLWLGGGQIAGALPWRAEISWDPAPRSPGEGEAICKKIRLVKGG